MDTDLPGFTWDHHQDGRVVKALDLRSNGLKSAWVQVPFLVFLPVDNSTHVNLQVAEGSQLLLLYQDQVDTLVVHSQQAHAALEDVKGVPAVPLVSFSGTT